MSVNRFKVRDIVITTDEFGARTFILIAVTETGYRAIAKKDKKRYNLTDKQIAFCSGQVPEDSPFLLDDIYDPKEGRRYCLHQARLFPAEAKKWQILANISSGSEILITHQKTIFRAAFVTINFNKPLYPIRAKIKGVTHDFKLESMLLKD